MNEKTEVDVVEKPVENYAPNEGDRMSKKISIDDLYFGILLYSTSFSKERHRLKTYNLFDSARVKWGVARWVTMADE